MLLNKTVAVRAPAAHSGWKWVTLGAKSIAWLLLIGAIVYYVRRDALHYIFRYTPDSYKSFWPIRILIRIHVAFAITMIFLGPLQFWTGLRMRYLTLHTWCGRVFLVTGTYVACTAMYMGLHPRLGGVVYGFGLFLNGMFWVAAASMAYYAIRLGNIQQHKEWMIRTYILACNGIVGDRILADIPVLTRRIGFDAVNDLSGWVFWTLPLMVAEIAIQLRENRRELSLWAILTSAVSGRRDPAQLSQPRHSYCSYSRSALRLSCSPRFPSDLLPHSSCRS